jgi:hypothetical protein
MEPRVRIHPDSIHKQAGQRRAETNRRELEWDERVKADLGLLSNACRRSRKMNSVTAQSQPQQDASEMLARLGVEAKEDNEEE